MTLKSSATSQQTGQDSKYTLRLIGIKATSFDAANDLVNVTVSTSRGYLTFDRRTWSLADPIHGRSAQRSGSLSFWASPFDVESIFANISYQCYTPGNDSIDIHLEYGECSELQNQNQTCQTLYH